MKREQPQQNKHAEGGGVARPAFTLAELLIVIAIIAILAIISMAAYLAVFRGAKEQLTKATLQTLSNAAQAYYDEIHDYPAMRFGDDLLSGLTPVPSLSTTPLPNTDQSIAAVIYQLQYRSSAGDLLKNLPASVLVPLTVNGTSCTVTDPPGAGGQVRQLYTIHDGWGNAVQYLRARPAAKLSAGSPLSASALNNRVLLVSMGKDGQPGQEGTDAPAAWQDPDDTNNPKQSYPNPAILKLGKGDDIVVQVGSAQ